MDQTTKYLRELCKDSSSWVAQTVRSYLHIKSLFRLQEHSLSILQHA